MEGIISLASKMEEGMQEASKSWEKQVKDFLLESPGGMQTCQHPDFGPERPILNSDLQKCKIMCVILSH